MTAAASPEPPDPPAPQSPPPRPRLLRRHRDFRQFWSATTVSQLGTQVSELAIPLVAILLLKSSPWQVGLLAASGYVPAALLGLPAGAWADRLRRRTILLTADVARGLVLASIPVAYLLGRLGIGQLCVVMFCVGGLSVFFDVAYPAYLPSLVARRDLSRANSQLQVSEQGAGVLGPGLAGWLITLFGAPLAVAVDAASYLISAGFVFRIRHREALPAPAASTDSRPQIRMTAQIREGLRHVATSRQLRWIALSAAIINLFGRMIVVLVPIYLVRQAGYGAAAIGIIFAMGSAGFLLGAAFADRIGRRLGLGPSILAGGIVAASSFLLIAVPPAGVAGPFVAAALFIYGTGALTFTIGNLTWRQLTTPTNLLGRVTSSMRLLIWVTQPVAGLVAGWLGTRIGLHAALWIGAVGALCAPIALLAAGLRTERLTDGTAAAPSPV